MILNSSELDRLEDNENLVIVNYANSTFNYKSSNNIKIIEDAAQSFGVTFKKQPVGTLEDTDVYPSIQQKIYTVDMEVY